MNDELKAALQSLLTYEGGDFQSLHQTLYAEMFNDKVIAVAEKHGITLDLNDTGRK